jgi:hypothetical protein
MHSQHECIRNVPPTLVTHTRSFQAYDQHLAILTKDVKARITVPQHIVFLDGAGTHSRKNPVICPPIFYFTALYKVVQLHASAQLSLGTPRTPPQPNSLEF